MKEHSRLLRPCRAGQGLSGWVRAGFAAVGLALAGVAAAQPIPKDAKAVWLTFTGRGWVVMDEVKHRLPPSALIRGDGNRLVLPGSLRGRYPARVIVDANGAPWRIWIGKPRAENTGPITP